MVTYWLLGRTVNSDSNLRSYNTNIGTLGRSEGPISREENRILPPATVKAADAPPYNAPTGVPVQAGGKGIQQGPNPYPLLPHAQVVHEFEHGSQRASLGTTEIGETTVTSDIAVPAPKMPTVEPPSYEQLEAELAREGTKSPPIVQLVEGYHY